jgi:hypothetical protein
MNKDEIQKILEERIDDNKLKIKKTRKALRLLEKGKWHYQIDLDSMWKDYGEKGFKYEAEEGESLEDAIKHAEEGFMEQNKRSDVQAWRFATIVFENNEAIRRRIYRTKQKK